MVDILSIHYLIELSNIIVASIFFLSFGLIIKAVAENKQNTKRPASKLALLLAAIFVTCGSGHVAHLATTHFGTDNLIASLGPALYFWLVADAATAAVSIAFIIMRKNAGIIIDGPYAIMETKDKLKLRNEQIQALHKLTSVADNTLDLDELTRNVLLTSSELMGMKGGAIYLIDKNQQSKLTLAASSDPSLFASHMPINAGDLTDSINAVSQVLRTLKLFIAQNSVEVLSSGLNIRYAESLILLPLKKNELVGIFLLFDTKPRSFIQEEIAFLEAMSSQIGNAIEKARLYKDVVTSHKQLTESKQQSDLLTDLMSHDIRNYEQIIQGNLDFALMDRSLSNETREYIQKAFEASHGTTRIIENVKKLGRLGKYKDVPSHLSPINIIERIEKCAEVVKETYAGEKRRIEIRITAKAHDNKQQSIKTFADEFIDDIFLNLLGNAIKYDNSDEVQIDVTVERDSSRLLVSIADCGRGIPDDKKQLIFQRYTLTSSGSGLGLSICKAVVERYSGKIWVENRVRGDYSKGSAFKVELPLASVKKDDDSATTAFGQIIER